MGTWNHITTAESAFGGRAMPKNKVLKTDERTACRIVIGRIIAYQPEYSTATYVTQRCVESLGFDWGAVYRYVYYLIDHGFLIQREGTRKGFPIVLEMRNWDSAYRWLLLNLLIFLYLLSFGKCRIPTENPSLPSRGIGTPSITEL